MRPGAARKTLVLLLLMGATVWADEQALVLTGSDVLCRPGEKATLAVKVEESGWRHKDVERALVSAFHVTETGRKPLGRGVTDEEGWVELPVRFDEPGLYRVAVEAVPAGEDVAKRGREEFLVACRRPERVAVVLDIDDTLTASDAAVLSASPAVRDPDTVAVVSALAQRYDLLYLTGRPRWMSSRTRRWLRTKGFPPAPLFMRDLKRSRALRSGADKTRLLGQLRRHFPNILVGVGDEDSDVEAYTSNGMVAILIEEEEDEAWNVQRWSQIEELLLGKEVTFAGRLSGEVVLAGKDWRFSCTRQGRNWRLSAPGLGPVLGAWPEVRQALFDGLREQGRGP